MLEAEQILGSGDQELGIVVHIADSHVASVAEQCADLASRVIVIDVQHLAFSIARSCFGLLANFAEMILLSVHLLIGRFVKIVVREQLLSSSFAVVILFVSNAIQQAAFFTFFRRSVFTSEFFGFSNASSASTIFSDSHLSFDVTTRTNRSRDVSLGEPRLVTLAHLRANVVFLFGRCISPLLAARDASAFAAIPIVEYAHKIFVVAVFAEVGRCFHSVRSLTQYVAHNQLVTID